MVKQIVTFPYDVANDLEGVLLSVDANGYAHILCMNDYTVLVGLEYQITYTGETIEFESITIEEAA